MKRKRKAVAIILSIFILVLLFSFATLSSYQYISDSQIQIHYENSLQALYDLESARVAILWEQANAPIVNNWDTDTTTATYDSVCRLKAAQIGADGFYRLTGYNFKAKTENDDGQSTTYIHAFQGTETAPQDSRYLEYINSPSPMYKFAIFSNDNLTFSGAALYDIKGGAIHSNKDIIFKPTGLGVRFNDVSEFSSSGTIKYANRLQYPAPHIIDNLDGSVDQMAPAPYYTEADGYYSTTTGELITPGPYRYWHTDSQGIQTLAWRWYGSWVAGSWGKSGKVPLIWRGNETTFYGRQKSGSGYYTDEIYTKYMYGDGEATGSYWNWRNAENKPIVNRFYLSRDDSLYSHASPGPYYQSDVHFRPSQDKEGKDNAEWFQIPGGLPQEHTWDKYRYLNSSEKSVTFYITEKCLSGSAGCKVSKKSDPANIEGWRYMKTDTEGIPIGQSVGDLLALNNEKYKTEGTPVKAQDYKTGGTKVDKALFDQCIFNCCGYKRVGDSFGFYRTCMRDCYATEKDRTTCQKEVCSAQLQKMYDCSNCDTECRKNSLVDHTYFDEIKKSPNDNNTEFFADKKYTYGDDATDPSSWLTKSFDSEAQPEGFSEYLSQLSAKGIEGSIQSGVEKKEPFLGDLFDTVDNDSSYKEKAKKRGLYVDDISDVVSALNEGLSGDEKIAQITSFYNWKTGQEVTLIDIDVEVLRKYPDKVPANGIIYSEVPLRLSNARELPGTNAGGKKAVFTLISEESIYLKGDYNITNWKISNIATKKKVYTLSDNFNDPQSPPALVIYPEYPYVFVNVQRDNLNKITNYLPTSDESKDGAWINANYTGSKYTDGSYYYYKGMDDATRAWSLTERNNLQKEHKDSGISMPNRVCKDGSESCSYTYNSLFITPYDDNKGDNTLENWYYINADGKEVRAEKNMIGAFLNFNDPNDPNYDDEYKSSLGSEESTWDYYQNGENSLPARSASDNRPLNYWYVQHYGARVGYSTPITNQGYDDRFPQASPTNSAGVLGFTGGNSWRLVSKAYFTEQTQ